NEFKSNYYSYLLKTHWHAHGLEKALEIIRPNHIISPASSGLSGFLGELGNKLGALSVLISHGSHVKHEERFAAYEHFLLARNILIGDYSFIAVQSPHAQKMAQSLTDKNKIVAIHPVLWGRQIKRRERMNGESLTLVHAGTSKPRGHVKYIYENSNEMIEGLKDVCEVVKDLPNLRLIIKIRPSRDEYDFASLKVLLPESSNIIFETEKPFLKVLEAADLLLSFSSTTIEEALNNRVPVLLYGGSGRYCHIPSAPSEKINGAVTFAQDKVSLEKILNYLNAQKKCSVPDKEFEEHTFRSSQCVNIIDWFSEKIKEK
ncbi:hypothetical protein KKB18_04900, partial [bacterium]|nr:hypothetical protein [bacterium]